ncbi:hypothetical protein PENTCL1PPCAC_20503 [Pristionchus entomophagus]|uniref:F-box domain-containing protein n=1 Tax=Pristionchus entomophagus TaxID=358040 RepID=A0AAV5TWD8_9BILA|nr:hypothetical protein PENTCL1PPCAC_20503 [Pristionchus entomophagus]
MNKGMDILALPHVFLNKLMRRVEIKDRLRLRQTCRTFEKIVAETNAGYFEIGGTAQRNGTISMSLGDAHFASIEYTEHGLDDFLHLRNRLFNGISFGKFQFNVNHSDLFLDFIRTFTDHFKFKIIHFVVEAAQELENALQVMADFSSTTFSMDLWFVPATEKLLSIPPLETIMIAECQTDTNAISTVLSMYYHYGKSPYGLFPCFYSRGLIKNTPIVVEVFFKLLTKHKTIYMGGKPAMISSSDLKEIMQIISSDTRERLVSMTMKCTDIQPDLRYFGVTEDAKNGDVCGEFEVLEVPQEPLYCTSMLLRYRKCWITIQGNVWGSSDTMVTVNIANCERLS